MVIAYAILAMGATFLELAEKRPRLGYFNRDAVAWEGHAWSLTCGQIAGRDYVSTYGPLAQFLSWVGVALHENGDYLSSPPRIDAVFRWTGILATCAALSLWPFDRVRQVVLATAAWWLFGLPWHYAVMRTASACVVLLLAERLLSRSARNPHWPPVLAGALCLLPGLITPDMSIFLAVTVTVVALTMRSRERPRTLGGKELRQGLVAAVLVVAGFVLMAGLIEIVFFLTSDPTTRRFGAFEAETWRMMSTYSLTVGKAWTESSGSGWGMFTFLLTTLWIIGNAARKASPGARSRWIALGCFSLTGLTGALIRSDPGHIALGLTPAVLALGLAAPRRLAAREALGWWLALAIGIVAWPKDDPSRASERLRRLVTTSPSVAWSELRRGEAPEAPFPEGVLDAARSGAGPLFPHPWQNHLGPASGRCLAQRIDQTYKAHDLELQRRQVESLEAANAGLSVWIRAGEQLDGVQDVSRSPVVIQHLLESFEPVPPRGRVGPWLELRQREAPRELSWQLLPTAVRSDSRRSPAYRLDRPTSCGLLRLEMTLSYRNGSPGFKSQRVLVRLQNEGSEVLESVLVPLTASGRFSTFVESRQRFLRAALSENPLRSPGLAFDEIAFEPEPGDVWTRGLEAIELTQLSCLSSS